MTRNLKEFVNHETELRGPFDACGPGHVAILLAHYNGAVHLSDQLQSLTSQTHRDWSLILSDDGSTDNWLTTAVEFARANADNRVWLVSGPQKGFARNFLSLIGIAGPTVPFVAYCDQDDVWLPGKLARAIEALQKVPPDIPGLYCGRTTVCDRALTPLRPSPHFRAPPAFENALVQNIGGGNTMVLNRAALDLLQDTARHAEEVVSHDWWTYQIVSGAGGQVLYDPEPSVLYRQHGANRVGANTGGLARFRRLRQLLKGEFRGWNAANTAALRQASHWLTPRARGMLDQFDLAREGNLPVRLVALWKSGVYRQTWQGQIALWMAAILKRL